MAARKPRSVETPEAAEPTTPAPDGVHWLTRAEARALFDAEAWRVMDMSGEEFLRRYDAGEFDDMPDDGSPASLDYWSLVLDIPLGR